MREMRRKERQLSLEETWAVVEDCVYGVLSVTGEDGRPYSVPLNFVRKDNCLYFHCAQTGQKLDFLRQNGAVCVSFVATADPDEANLTTKYRSATVFGTAEEVADAAEKAEALTLIARRFAPAYAGAAQKEIDALLSVTGVWRVTAETLTGKSNLKV